jgi:hypothetical protein
VTGGSDVDAVDAEDMTSAAVLDCLVRVPLADEGGVRLRSEDCVHGQKSSRIRNAC